MRKGQRMIEEIKLLVKRLTKNYPNIYHLILGIYNRLFLCKVIIGKRIFKDPENFMVNIGGEYFIEDIGKS